MANPNLLVGFETGDDAAVYRVSDTQAVIQTIDFFPPPVDDPYLFGQIAAANALSDVYAMGGTPVLALNLLAFPACLDADCVKRILQGGTEKVQEAGAVIAGGHTIEDQEPKYGLSVTGLVHPDKCWSNRTAQAGDVLILTKPLGLGIYALASRGSLLSEAEETEMLRWMTMLNRRAKEILEGFSVHACTDITGFGLLGHLTEMAQGSRKRICIFADSVPVLARAPEWAEMGIVPSGAYQNRSWLENRVRIEVKLPDRQLDCFYDPQTSGGLAAAIPADEAAGCLAAFWRQGVFAAKIGKVEETDGAGVVFVLN